MLHLDYRDARPIYEQVQDGLRRLLVSGAIQEGEKLPSVRAMASQLAINPNTIQRAYEALEQEGYLVENIDATIVAQEPKLRPFIPQMEKNVARTLHLSENQVNIKATTEEGLGFTGSRQGIAAQAVCSLTGLYEASMTAFDSERNCSGCGGCAKG